MALRLFVLVSFLWLRVLDKAEYSAFESTLNSSIVSYRIAVLLRVTNLQFADIPGDKSPLTFQARCCRKFYDLYASIYSNQ